jgi:hypothetical protein
MSISSIVYTTINENFPAAGQDNDSQGFRDNFARIKTALGTAQTEITYLNTNAIDRTKNNDMGNNTLSNVVLQGSSIRSDVQVKSGNNNAPNIITFSSFQYLRYSLSATDNIFQVDNWPVDSYASLYLEVVSATGTKRVRFQTGVINNSLGTPVQYVHLGEGFGNNNYFDVSRTDLNDLKVNRYLFKVASPDGGINVFVSLVDKFKEQPNT